MSQNNKSFKVRVICDDGITFDYPPISAICVATAIAIAEQWTMSDARCGVISRIEAQNTNFPITENTNEVALRKEVDRLVK
jgi:hypothetical protein